MAWTVACAIGLSLDWNSQARARAIHLAIAQRIDPLSMAPLNPRDFGFLPKMVQQQSPKSLVRKRRNAMKARRSVRKGSTELPGHQGEFIIRKFTRLSVFGRMADIDRNNGRAHTAALRWAYESSLVQIQHETQRAKENPAVYAGFPCRLTVGIGLRPSRCRECQGSRRLISPRVQPGGSGARCPRPQSPHVRYICNNQSSSAGSTSFPV
jgi:hypothetical protein